MIIVPYTWPFLLAFLLSRLLVPPVRFVMNRMKRVKIPRGLITLLAMVLLFGTLGLWLGLAGSLPAAAFWLMPVAILALVVNMINRIRSGLRAIQTP